MCDKRLKKVLETKIDDHFMVPGLDLAMMII